MKIAILETGRPPARMIADYGLYPAMFEALLGPGFEFQSYDVSDALPDWAEGHDAWLVTGAAVGVYDPVPWIAPLERFLRAAGGKTKLVGICFGHQIMAEAFGGHVEKSKRGWGVGLQTYEVKAPAPWMEDESDVAVPVSHQDQIVVQPPRSHVIAGNDFCPFGMLAYDDRPAISMQCHPEFEPAFAKALIESREPHLPDPAAALASLDAPNDSARVGDWIRRFLLS